ncbi:hypothetical protein MTO96_047276 [Rhipicephalus appendiculatus]
MAGLGNFFTYMIFGVGSKSQHFLYACCYGYSVNGLHFLITGLASQHVAEVLPITIYATGMFTGLLHLVHLIYVLIYIPSP